MPKWGLSECQVFHFENGTGEKLETDLETERETTDGDKDREGEMIERRRGIWTELENDRGDKDIDRDRDRHDRDKGRDKDRDRERDRQAGCYSLNAVSPQNSYVEILAHKVMGLGSGAQEVTRS